MDLDTNPDYIALKSTLSLLTEQRDQAQKDIVHLEALKKQALDDPIKFRDDLIATGAIRGAPSRQTPIPTPSISWDKYK